MYVHNIPLESKILQELSTQLTKFYLPGSCPISQTQNLREHQGLILCLSFQLDQITPHMFMSKTYPLLTGMFIWSNLKYCDDTQPESQLQKAEEQHRRLVAILKAQGCSKISLHVILMGVMGTIYGSYTDICRYRNPTQQTRSRSLQSQEFDKGP